MDVRSQDTTSQSLEKLDVSVENSNTSTRSDQTTLEYQDAPLPEDFEDILIASKSVSSSTELVVLALPLTCRHQADCFNSVQFSVSSFAKQNSY